MRVAVFGPDPLLVEQLASVDAELTHYRQIADVEPATWPMFDAVVLDLLALRVETAGADVDPDSARDVVSEAGRLNEDTFWLIITPPGLEDIGHRISRSLAGILQGGLPASEIATEPRQISQLIAMLEQWLHEVARIEGINISIQGARDLTHAEMRCIRRLLKDCDQATLVPLGNGQSDAIVFRAECTVHGGHAPDRVLKIGPTTTILREHKNYLDFARNKIGLARLPHHDSTDYWSAGPSAAIVYSFAGGDHPLSLHEVMTAGDGSSALSDLWDRVMAPMLAMRKAAVQPIGAFITTLLGGLSLDDVEALWNEDPPPLNGAASPIPWLRDISGRINDVSIPHVIAHGDLHAYNVLVDDADHAWLIDFYQTGWKTGLFDQAFSDVYLMLHRVPGRAAAVACSNEALVEAEISYYAGGDPVRPELAVVRTTALNTWGVDSVGLFHLARACMGLRLLRFDSTDRALAKTIAALAAERARLLNQDWEQAPEIAPITF
jgi:hypothetical protein